MIRYLNRLRADNELRADNDRLKADAQVHTSQLNAMRTALAAANRALADEQQTGKANAASAGKLIDSIKDVFVQKIRELDNNMGLAVERADRLEADLGAARDANWLLRKQLADALNATPLPTALSGQRAVLTPAQRDLAADDAAWKRAQDGLGDPQ
jgi:hypothetical protein